MNITEINYKEKMCNTEKTLLISMFRVTFYRPFNLKTCFFYSHGCILLYRLYMYTEKGPITIRMAGNSKEV